jgi:hypothetical protein
MRTLPALACDVEEMFHTYKVTGKECKYPCATEAGDKDIVAAVRLCCIYTRRDLHILPLTLSVM